jgi:hypothetical protein
MPRNPDSSADRWSRRIHHHRLGEVARPVRQGHRVGKLPDFCAGLIQGTFYALVAGNPRHIGVDHNGALAERDRGDRGSSVGTGGNLRNSPSVRGKPPSATLPGTSDQISGPGIIASQASLSTSSSGAAAGASTVDSAR